MFTNIIYMCVFINIIHIYNIIYTYIYMYVYRERYIYTGQGYGW